MKIPEKARYDYVAFKSSEFITQEKIHGFPISPYEIIHQHKWALKKYSSLAVEMDCSIDDISSAFKTDEAYSIFNGNNYTIAYNDTKIKDRIWFTLMHEIGHIYLGHFKDFEKTIIRRDNMTKSEYKVLENEANAFARNVLAPAPIVEQLKEISIKKICDYFHLSADAAKTRLNLLNSDKYWNTYSNVNFTIISRFFNYFIIKHCKVCNNTALSTNDNYCFICGNKSFKFGEGIMKYTKIEVHNNGKVQHCPICQNEETEVEGNYCQICATLLVNKCDDRMYNPHNFNEEQPCGQALPSNARYCPACGTPSTFLNDNILKPWNSRVPTTRIYDGFMHVPDDIEFEIPDGVEDEGLPFN